MVWPRDSSCGGGVVSAELCLSCCSEYLEAAGDGDSASLGKSFAESGGVVVSLVVLFIATSTLAASRSCTCWCLEIKSLEVRDHSGVCSHLAEQFRQRHRSFKPQRTRVSLNRVPSNMAFVGRGRRTSVWSDNCCACTPFHTSRSGVQAGCFSCLLLSEAARRSPFGSEPFEGRSWSPLLRPTSRWPRHLWHLRVFRPWPRP